MSRRLISLLGGFALTAATSAAALAQTTPTQPTTTTTQQPATTQTTTTTTQPAQTQTTTTTQTTQAVQNADGSWTVIEYPAQKEVVVDFAPGADFSTAKGRAKVMRMADHTMVTLDLSGLPTTTSSLNVYAVDPVGKVTLLGPVTFKEGAVTHTLTTPLDKFMIFLSPDANLTTYGPDTTVAFRSTVPQGFAVVPLASTDHEDGAPVGEKVAATSTAGATSTYSVPMLNVPGMARGEDTQIKVNLAGALTGSRVNFNIEPRKDGPTMITARFHELKEAPAGKVYTLWAVSPDNKFTKLGQVVNTGNRNEAEIKSETTLPDFGLLITLEDEAATSPHGEAVVTTAP
ncbi:MAG TPA: hypothetical protein VG148_13750 [Pyrinomonadaceae bacterium]|nr:hypothetical protein [Pyrinomonadaceae bacterium]